MPQNGAMNSAALSNWRYTGYAAGWQLSEIPTPKELAALAEPYHPYRNVEAWYCRRVLDDRAGSS